MFAPFVIAYVVICGVILFIPPFFLGWWGVLVDVALIGWLCAVGRATRDWSPPR